MSMDETTEHSPAESEILQTLSSGPLSSSLANLSASSRAIPTEKDFHFYYNFDEFKLPIQKIAEKSHSLLEAIGSPDNPVLKDKNKNIRFPADLDIDEAYDWLVNLNDEVLDHFDMSIDEFKKIRDKEEEARRRVSGVDNDDGFQLVQGRKKKGALKAGNGGSVNRSDLVGVKVADNKKAVAVGGKAKVPFHIPTIRKPQEENCILVNNSNLPFEHVWLERSDDGLQFIHPLEKLSVLDLVDSNSGDVEPVSPPPLEHTPFKMVEEVKDLKEMAAKLRSANEFAVDLEHNQYRSFQGLTCLMQISTRTEDFIVDTLKLRIHIGPYLREVFKDPKKKKVMHGADRDIIWLQRDFGIYVCNMFDTGQASRVLKLERNSLEHLLSHFCGITANKEYQNADWRLRPLPKEMVKYAREDTHYLLYIYDLMRALLLSMPNDPENYDPPLVEVYKRSYDVCMQLYEKEILTESSYLYLYGLNRAGFNAQQLAVASALFEWRDAVARSEDESTGYILPNKTLLEIAKEMPVTTNKLHRLLKTKHSYIDRNLGTVVGIIRHAMQNSSAFEATAQRLKEELIETAAREEVEVNDEGELVSPDAAKTLENPTPGREGIYHGEASDASVTAKQKATLQLGRNPKVKTGNMTGSRDGKGSFFKSHDKNEVMVGSEGRISERSGGSPLVSQQSNGANTADVSPAAPKVSVAAVQVSKKPTGGFASLLGGAASKRKFDIHKKVNEEMKLEKIRSSVNLPFHSFTGAKEPPKQVVEECTAVPEFPPEPEEPVSARATKSNLEEIIVLDEDSDVEEMLDDNSETTSSQRDKKCAGSGLGINKEDEPISLTDLSKSFEKCLKSNNQNKKTSKMEKSRDTTAAAQFKPFDYAAAIRFGDGLGKSKARAGKKQNDSAGKKQSAAAAGRGAALINDSTEFRQGRRRLAFPATGNRSATFR